jgi:hypothetical protein
MQHVSTDFLIGQCFVNVPPPTFVIRFRKVQRNHNKVLFIGHSEVFEKMTDEWPSLMATWDKIVPINSFGRRFIVELPPKSA